MHSGGGDGGMRRRSGEPSMEDNAPKRSKTDFVNLELGVHKSLDLQSEPGWEMVPEPWTATSAMEYIKFVHLDKWWPTELWEKHCAARAVTYTHIKDLNVKWRFLEILRAISNLERWPKNNIPKSIATLMYVECEMGKRVDWSTLHKPYSGGRVLRCSLSAKKPEDIPKNIISQWFRKNPSLFNDPNESFPVDRETLFE